MNSAAIVAIDEKVQEKERELAQARSVMARLEEEIAALRLTRKIMDIPGSKNERTEAPNRSMGASEPPEKKASLPSMATKIIRIGGQTLHASEVRDALIKQGVDVPLVNVVTALHRSAKKGRIRFVGENRFGPTATAQSSRKEEAVTAK